MKTKETQLIITATSPSAAGTSIHTTSFKSDWLVKADFLVVDGIITGAVGGTLDIILQRKVQPDIWIDWIGFGQVLAAAAKAYQTMAMDGAGTWAVNSVGGGTDAVATPLIPAGTNMNIIPGGEVRIVWKAGASTSAGASQTIIITPYTNFT